MARWQFRWSPPADDEMMVRLVPGCFDALIGTVVPHRMRETAGGPVLAELGAVRLAAAEVAADGTSALLTVETVATDMLPAPPAPAGSMSFETREIPESWRPGGE